MSEDQAQEFDFRAASTSEAVELSSSMEAWTQLTMTFFTERWNQISNNAAEATTGSFYHQTFGDFTEAIENSPIVAKISSAGNKLESLLVFEQASAIQIVNSILNEAGPEAIAREMTSVESSLLELVIQEFSASLVDSWRLPSQVAFEVSPLEMDIKRSKLYPPAEVFLDGTVSLKLETVEKPFEFGWKLKQKDFETVMTSEKGTSKPSEIAEQITSIPVQLHVELGETEMSMTDITQLCAGDVILLNKSIDEPLNGYIDGQPFLVGWPGRTGQKQSLRVTEIV